MSNNDETPTSLLTRCRENDSQAWNRLADLYSPLILYWCTRADVSRNDQHDIFQNVMLTLAQKLSTFGPRLHVGQFRAWLRRITFSRINDHFRAVNRDKGVNSEGSLSDKEQAEYSNAIGEPLSGEEEQNEQSILNGRLMKMLETTFSPVMLDIFYMLECQKMTSSEVAEKLGMTPTNVRQIKYRMLKRIRDEFEELL